MIILVSKADKTVQDFTMSYNIDENGMYISENMQGHRIEEPYVSERFDVIDVADSKIPVDDTGNYISLKPKHWLYVDGQLVKNFNYVDEDLERVRKSKLISMRAACKQAIVAGFDVQTTKGSEHFSLDIDDQINISQNTLKAQSGESVLYHADGEECRVFAPDEMLAMATAAEKHKTRELTYHNLLKRWVNRETDAKTLNDIVYGSDLPDDLQTVFHGLTDGDGV